MPLDLASKSGQFMCYKTGQFYVPLTEEIMSVQIMRRKRTDFQPGNLLKDYLAYTGHFEVDDTESIVVFHVETDLTPF